MNAMSMNRGGLARAVASMAAVVVGMVGCGTAPGDGNGEPDPQPDMNTEPCDYPADAPTVMQINEVWPKFSWNSSLDGERTDRSLDMEEVYCASDDDYDWSPFDVLLFVSIPAW